MSVGGYFFLTYAKWAKMCWSLVQTARFARWPERQASALPILRQSLLLQRGRDGLALLRAGQQGPGLLICLQLPRSVGIPDWKRGRRSSRQELLHPKGLRPLLEWPIFN